MHRITLFDPLLTEVEVLIGDIERISANSRLKDTVRVALTDKQTNTETILYMTPTAIKDFGEVLVQIGESLDYTNIIVIDTGVKE